MTERQVAGYLAGLSVSLIAAETVLAIVFGFNPGLVLFLIGMYVGAVGLLYSLRTLLQGTQSVESVSERRARAMQDAAVSRVLKGYEVDDEFIRPGQTGRKREHDTGQEETVPAPEAAEDEQLRDAIVEHAARAGGFGKLKEMIEQMDGEAFSKMTLMAGMRGVTKEQAIRVVREMSGEDSLQVEPAEGDSGEPPFRLSMDQDSFDEYIRRSMSQGEDDLTTGFESKGSSASNSPVMPTATDEITHDPEKLFERLRQKRGVT